MKPWGAATVHLHQARWGLLAVLMVITIVTRDERGWWLLPVAALLLSGFWAHWVAALHDRWTLDDLSPQRRWPTPHR
ncbi:hypothetical protein L615_000400000530 [Nocardioides sp. J9]|uniref:hypothetical protein n=1 Tax=unclassified Nocardioides TaxID=2615069 RepID=UPI00048AA9B6|nr:MULTISPECIES: hypothetical protein [unclassified Nocardioides]TWG96951.1 hypothetical protein L615_000400000530 [Nocardioides sp. J9]